MPPLSGRNNVKPMEPMEPAPELGKSKQTGVLFETDAETPDGALAADVTQFMTAEKRKFELVWRNIFLFGYLHLAAFYGVYLIFTTAKWATLFFCKYDLIYILMWKENNSNNSNYFSDFLVFH